MATHDCIIANGALDDARFASGNVLLDWSQFDPSGLVLYHANEGTLKVVADSSGNANNAALNNANWNASPWMGASAMGASAVLTPGSVPALGNASWTMELWLYVASNAGDLHRDIYSSYVAPSGQYAYLSVRHVASFFRVEFYLMDNAGHTSSIVSYTDNGPVGNWTHMALVKDGNTARLYINGVQRSTYDVTGWTWSTWTGRTWVTNAYQTGLDEMRDSATAVYPDGTTFYPIRYPASGSWTEASGEAQGDCEPGILTATLAEALPAGTSLKARMIGTGGGDTDWQTMTGSDVTYTYDFTGETADDWYGAVQLFPGGALNINTPELDAVAFAYESATKYGSAAFSGESSFTAARTLVQIEQESAALSGESSFTAAHTLVQIEQESASLSGESTVEATPTVHELTTQPTPDVSDYRNYQHNRSRYAVQSWRVSEGRCLPWLTQDPPADFITRGIWHGILSEFDHIADAGFTTAFCPTVRTLYQEVPALVAAATTYGIKVVVLLKVTPQVAHVAAYDGDSAVAGWYVYDEPNDDTTWDTKLDTFMGYKTAWATTKPLMAACSQVSYDEYRDRFRAWLAESEIALHDNYPYRFNMWPRAFSFDTSTGLATNLPIAQDIAEAQAKEHWVLTQAHGHAGTATQVCQPPEDFLRAQTYFALISGATGYAHFALDSAYLRAAQLYGIALNPPLTYGTGKVLTAAQRAESVLLWRQATTLNAEVLARESEWLSRSSALDIRVGYIPTLWSWSDNPIRYGCRGAGPYWLTLVNIEGFEHTVRVTLPFTPSSISRDFGPTETQTGPTFTLTMPAWSTWGAEISE